MSAAGPRRYHLLTGATGQVGSHVLAELLAAHEPVAVLVRGEDWESAAVRIEALLAPFEQFYDRSLARPTVLLGEINRENLGLSAGDRGWVRQNVGSIIHSAASLSFREAASDPHNEPYRTNVEGLKNVLAVGRSAHVAQWHIISTAYIAGLREGVVRETELDVGQDSANDYERSKIIAEEIVREAIPSPQLTIYRPSIVVDTQPTGHHPNRTVYHLLEIYRQLTHLMPRPDDGDLPRSFGLAGDERKNIVAADWVAERIATIVRSPDHHGQTFHLTSPSGISIDEIDAAYLSVVDEERGWPVKADASGASAGKGATIEALAATFQSSFGPYFRNDPEFDTANTDAVPGRRHFDWRQSDVKDLAELFITNPILKPAIDRTFIDQLEPAGDAPLDDAIGLIVSGNGGFDGRLLPDGRVIRGGGEACECRLYLHRQTLGELIDGLISPEQAVAIPRGWVEGSDETVLASAIEALAALGAQPPAPVAASSEVVHV